MFDERKHNETVEDHVSSADRVQEGGHFFFGPGGRKFVRVPGKMVGACKREQRDVEPCLLLEVHVDVPGVRPVRMLGKRVRFHDVTDIVQSVEQPNPVNGAIIWLETEGPVTIHG